MCCACGGGDTRICENTDNGAKNSNGRSCVDVAILHNHGVSTCKSDYDTPTFTVSSMCCACGGGRTILSTNSSSEICHHVPSTHLDIEGDTCTHYRKYQLGAGCDGAYDDDDFTASEMCCGCGGSDTRFCANTNHDLVDAAENTCSSYLTQDDCDGQVDTPSFTAQEFCCACGGGFQWYPGSIYEPSTTFACFDLPSNNVNALCSEHDQDTSTCGQYVYSIHPLLSLSLSLSLCPITITHH